MSKINKKFRAKMICDYDIIEDINSYIGRCYQKGDCLLKVTGVHDIHTVFITRIWLTEQWYDQYRDKVEKVYGLTPISEIVFDIVYEELKEIEEAERLICDMRSNLKELIKRIK